MDIQLQEGGAKRRLNGTSKKNRRTDGQRDRRTHTRTDGRTFRLIESIGPEGRCFENKKSEKINKNYEALQASALTLVSQRWTDFCSMAWTFFWITFGIQLTLRHTAFRISTKIVVCNHRFLFRQLLVPKMNFFWPF